MNSVKTSGRLIKVREKFRLSDETDEAWEQEVEKITALITIIYEEKNREMENKLHTSSVGEEQGDSREMNLCLFTCNWTEQAILGYIGD